MITEYVDNSSDVDSTVKRRDGSCYGWSSVPAVEIVHQSYLHEIGFVEVQDSAVDCRIDVNTISSDNETARQLDNNFAVSDLSPCMGSSSEEPPQQHGCGHRVKGVGSYNLSTISEYCRNEQSQFEPTTGCSSNSFERTQHIVQYCQIQTENKKESARDSVLDLVSAMGLRVKTGVADYDGSDSPRAGATSPSLSTGGLHQRRDRSPSSKHNLRSPGLMLQGSPRQFSTSFSVNQCRMTTHHDVTTARSPLSPDEPGDGCFPQKWPKDTTRAIEEYDSLVDRKVTRIGVVSTDDDLDYLMDDDIKLNPDLNVVLSRDVVLKKCLGSGNAGIVYEGVWRGCLVNRSCKAIFHYHDMSQFPQLIQHFFQSIFSPEYSEDRGIKSSCRWL